MRNPWSSPVFTFLSEARILAALDPLFGRYAAERQDGERFGDYVIRAGIVQRVDNPAEDFHD